MRLRLKGWGHSPIRLERCLGYETRCLVCGEKRDGERFEKVKKEAETNKEADQNHTHIFLCV